MKNYKLLLPAAMIALSACSPSTRSGETTNADTASKTILKDTVTEEKGLTAKMQIANTIKAGNPVEMKFTVYNNADTAQKFCKWHTPFEPLISKYLDVKDENGEEAAYQGAMAKRIMPPPADSYLTVKPKDSLSVTVDVTKGYRITKPGTYTVNYSGQGMSGLIVKDSVSFTYAQ